MNMVTAHSGFIECGEFLSKLGIGSFSRKTAVWS